MDTCAKCVGRGLISTGAVPHDLSLGNTVTCPDCQGSGRVGVSSAAPVDSATAPSGEQASPKVEEASSAAATGDASGTPSAAGIKQPQAGDLCELPDGTLGVLSQDGEGGWLCVPKPPQVV